MTTVTTKIRVFLQANSTLGIDTRHFDTNFTARLLDAIGDIESQTDGVAFHSENFQALNLLQGRYREQVDCVFIDPPYNTGNDDFVYKDRYRHSTWASMISDRLRLARATLRMTGSLWCTLDGCEASRFWLIVLRQKDWWSAVIAIRIAVPGTPR